MNSPGQTVQPGLSLAAICRHDHDPQGPAYDQVMLDVNPDPIVELKNFRRFVDERFGQIYR